MHKPGTPTPENCPDPKVHSIFRYCPYCTWTEPKKETWLDRLPEVGESKLHVFGEGADQEFHVIIQGTKEHIRRFLKNDMNDFLVEEMNFDD